MNRFIISFLLVVCTLTLKAQELTVVSMQPTMDVLTTNDLRKDLNGNYCAVVYVQTTEPGLKFKGNVIGDVDFESSQYTVHLTSGSKSLRIMGDTFVPVTINFSDYGIGQLEGKHVYALNVEAPSSNGPKKMDLGENYATFILNPKSNGIIYLDNNEGEPIVEGEWRGRLPYGEHHYRITAKGYRESTGTITVAKGEPTQKDITMESLLAQLSVKCSTTEAKIYIDDELKGTGNYAGTLPAGRYVVEARHPSYVTYSEVVTLEESGNKTLNIPALTALTGTLDIDYSPTGTLIQIDGTDYGTSPRLVYDLLVGTHNVKLIKDGYETASLTTEVKDGETTTLKGSLNKQISNYSFTHTSSDEMTAEQIYEVGYKYYQDNNFTEAVKYYQKAADQGYAEAQYRLGFCYDYGFGVSVNISMAFDLYRKAAEQGHDIAQAFLASCYEYGRGVSEDISKAIEWYKKAAENGNIGAQNKLKELQK